MSSLKLTCDCTVYIVHSSTPLINFAELNSLSKIAVRIPTYIQSGETADLTCSYYLDSYSLYSIKWYKVM